MPITRGTALGGTDNLAGNVSEQHVRHQKAPNEWDNRH